MPDGSFTPNLLEQERTDAIAAAAPQKDPRDVSTISFPYADLETAIDTARAILKAGGVPLSRDQLAGAMNQKAGSGNFSVKAGAARIFGLAETVAGKYQLTRLGFDILDSDETRVKAAMARAFLSVPLYRRTYDEFRNGQLPPRPLGLERSFAEFGVAPKQTDKARRAFENSARLAGFFDHGHDRLVEPVIGQMQRQVDIIRQAHGPMCAPDGPPEPPRPSPAAQDEPEPISAANHPFIKGLLLSLPKLGEAWAAPDRVKWLQAAAAGFDLMYKGGSPIRIDPAE